MSQNSASPVHWQPDSTLSTALTRARMLTNVRRFFAEQGVLEVETPLLATAAVSDPHLESLAVSLQIQPDRPCFLHTSAEFAMKRLLCADWPDIYQVCKVFRDGEIGPRHQPEFTMVEWYRRDLSLKSMMRHTCDFILRILDEIKPDADSHFISYADAFRRYADIDPITASLQEIKVVAAADPDLSSALGDDRNAWLDLILTQRVAAYFASDALTVLHHYPAEQAALARLCPDNAAVADRYEVFLGATELANGYFELQDADEQLRRCEQDQEYRRNNDRLQRPLDQEFLAAIRSGLPACCGVAVGFDRLVMLNVGATELRQVQTFAALR